MLLTSAMQQWSSNSSSTTNNKAIAVHIGGVINIYSTHTCGITTHYAVVGQLPQSERHDRSMLRPKKIPVLPVIPASVRPFLLAQILVCYRSFTEKLVCYAAVSLLQLSWVLFSVSICFYELLCNIAWIKKNFRLLPCHYFFARLQPKARDF